MITLLIPTLGNRKLELIRLLDSLTQQTYKDFKIIFVNQGDRLLIENITSIYVNLDIDIIHITKVGISVARNVGLKSIEDKRIVVLSDDDCWYPEDGLEKIRDVHVKNDQEIIFTQIYDPYKKVFYKKYSDIKSAHRSKKDLMGISSIEISFKNNNINLFDEKFGVGSRYPVGEEIDFLLRNNDKNMLYCPEITVYHRKKDEKDKTDGKIKAKGALYSKHFPFYITLIVLVRDFLIKRENNLLSFYNGYFEYRRLFNND